MYIFSINKEILCLKIILFVGMDCCFTSLSQYNPGNFLLLSIVTQKGVMVLHGSDDDVRIRSNILLYCYCMYMGIEDCLIGKSNSIVYEVDMKLQ